MPSVQRSTRKVTRPVWMQDNVTSANATVVTTQIMNPQFYYFLSTLASHEDPVTFDQTIKDNHWIAVMNSELNALELNGTLDIIDLPTGKQAIGSSGCTKQSTIRTGQLKDTSLVL